MKLKKAANTYIIRLEKGEEIIESLTKFCEDNNIKAGRISGIGGTNDVDIKYYDLENKEYLSENFYGKLYEIVSLDGNISLVEGKPFIHLHIGLGNSEHHMFGGHLSRAIVVPTCEIFVNVIDEPIRRKIDEEFGLNFWDF